MRLGRDIRSYATAGEVNSGHLQGRACCFGRLLPLASCRNDDLRTAPRADISVGPFSLGKAVLCLGPAPAKAGAAPDQLEPSPFGRAAFAGMWLLRSCSKLASPLHRPYRT